MRAVSETPLCSVSEKGTLFPMTVLTKFSFDLVHTEPKVDSGLVARTSQT